MQAGEIREIKGARTLAIFGNSVTTDHISPAGSITKTSPAGKYLIENGVQPADFNSYGSRRGNDRVMTRGTFANVRIKNLMVPGVEGGVTIFYGRDAAPSASADGPAGRPYQTKISARREAIPASFFVWNAEHRLGESNCNCERNLPRQCSALRPKGLIFAGI